MVPTTSQQYAAAQSEMLISWWRDWVRFLEARRTLNTLQQQRMTGAPSAAADAFDRKEAAASSEAQERQANAAQDRIPAARRAVFEAELNDRVAQYQQAASQGEDIITLTRQAIDELYEHAHGRVTTGKHAKLAAVPCEGRVWFTFPPEAIDALPPEAAYTLASPARGRLPRQRLLLFVVGMIILWGGGGAFMFWSQTPTAGPALASTPAALLVNDTPLQPWPVRSIRLGETTLPVARLDEAAWPAAPADLAGWRAGRAWPLELCLPATVTQPLPPSLILPGSADGLERTFAISADETRRPDLRLIECGSGRAVATGSLEASTPQARFAPGAQHSITKLGELSVTEVRVETSAQSSAIAPGRARVQIVMAAPEQVDWPAWLPVLRFLDGSEARTAIVQQADGLTTLTYDVPDTALGPSVEAIWQITEPGNSAGASYRWQLTLRLP